MQQTRIIRLLSTLGSSEIRRFSEFVHSPYFNKSSTVRDLFDYLEPFYPGFTGPGIQQEQVLQKGLGLPAHEVQKLHDANSSLTRLLEEFFSVEQLTSSPSLQTLQTCEKLIQSGREWYFPKKWKLGEDAPQTPSDYLTLYQAEEVGLRQAQRNLRRTGRSTHDERLKSTMKALDAFYLAQKLQLACETLNRQKIINSDDELDMLEEISDFLQNTSSPIAKIPLIRLYHGVLRLLTEETDEAFHQFMSRLDALENTLGRDTGIAMYAYAQNYCIRQINTGRIEFLDRLFELYVSLLDNGFILEADNSLAHWNYKNITTVALRLKKFDWVSSFLESYKKKLHEDIRESVYRYNMAATRYEQQDYAAALKFLQQTVFMDVHYDLSARSMLLKIFFELEDDEALGYSFQAFEGFLRRNKAISKEHYLIHKNLIRFLKKIHRLKHRIGQLTTEEAHRRYDLLQAELLNASAVANKSWLSDKLAEMHRHDSE